MQVDSANRSIYDYPLYYDILFGWDRTQEADFYESVFRHLGIGSHEEILEVACGTGQIARVLARRGWRLCGLDNREPMLEFLRQYAEASVRTHCADMVGFHCGEFGAAYNPLSSLLLLDDDAKAEAHLESMATALRPGGVYVLDLGFASEVRPDAPTTDETWEESRGEITVRAENEGVFVTDAGRPVALRWGAETHLRAVTSQWFEDRLLGRFTIESWHPESGRTNEGVSQWRLDVRTDPPVLGRAMVVLRRT